MIQKREKVGAIGLEPKRCLHRIALDVNLQTAKREKSVSNVLLPEVGIFKVQRYSEEPWGLICNVIVNQPTRPSLL